MALRIGRVPYLHAEPLYVDMARRGLALTELTPRAIGVAAADGEIDAGPIPLVESFRLEEPHAGRSRVLYSQYAGRRE